MTGRGPTDPVPGAGSVGAVARRRIARSRFLLDTDEERRPAPSRRTSPSPAAVQQDPPPAAEHDPPPAGVVVGDLSVASRYLPAGGGAEPVAGDFYDVLEAGPHRLVLVPGDVEGHGLAAVTRMRALRPTSRSVALRQLRPREALAELDILRAA